MKLSSKSGFSIVELMVVVAIIGILATIAVPNFQKFQAKAKQSNAKSELTGVFTAQKSFFAEYGTYHGNLAGIGFVPEGLDATTLLPSTGVQRYYATSAGDGALPVAFGVAPLGGLSTVGLYLTYAALNQYNYNLCNGVAAANSDGQITTPSATGFRAVANGCPRQNATIDRWTINQDRSLINQTAGI